MGSPRIIAIHPDDIDEVWDKASIHIDSALAHTRGELELSTVYENIKSGEQFLLLVNNNGIIASIVGEIVDESIKCCHIVACGGSQFDLWKDEWFKVIKELADSYGCKRLSVSGRKGWIKKLSNFGFKHAYTTLSVDL